MTAECLFETRQSLCGPEIVIPVDISEVYLLTDNMAVLHWIVSSTVNFDKMSHLKIFVRNKLKQIEDITAKCPMKFFHIAGKSNPADNCTRYSSFKVLNKSEFYEGPKFLSSFVKDSQYDYCVELPNKNVLSVDEVPKDNKCSVFCQQAEESGTRGILRSIPR